MKTTSCSSVSLTDSTVAQHAQSFPASTGVSKANGDITPITTGVKKVKRLTASARRDIELKNHARKLAGLSLIVIKERKCIACKKIFESAGDRTCGCQSRKTGYIAGREII